MLFRSIHSICFFFAAQVVGDKLHNIAKKKQILCITHLPQIAANADTHFCISKNSDGNRTYTTIKKLNDIINSTSLFPFCE